MADDRERQMPFCQRLLANKCNLGENCRYRHRGIERPTATAFACEASPPETKPPKSLTVLVDGSTQVKLTAGAIITETLPLDSLESGLKLDVLTSSLELTWYCPTRTAWLHYDQPAFAEEASRALNGQTIRGIKLASVVKSSRDQRCWTTQISNLTDSIEEEHIIRLLPGHLRNPRRKVFGKFNYEPDVPQPDILRDLVTSLSKLKIAGSEIPCATKSSSRLKQTARFEFDGCKNIAPLALDLHERRVVEFGNTRIFASERLKAVLSLAGRVYLPHAKAFKRAAREVYRTLHVTVHINDTLVKSARNSSVHVYVCGTSRRDLREAKTIFDRILAASISERLERPVGQHVRQTHRIRLTKTKEYRRVTSGGLEDAIRAVGAELIQLDDHSDPPAVIITGDIVVLRKAQKALFPDRADVSLKLVACEVCLEETESLVKLLQCSHACCRDCFRSYCMADTESKLPLTCFSPDCDTIVPIALLQTVLNRDDIHHVARDVVALEFRSHPERYAKCPGPDCLAHYKINRDDEDHVCPICFTISCVECEVEHTSNETCEDYKNRPGEDIIALEQWMAGSKAKYCKRCKTIIEKIDGCDHMQCLGCLAHICFKCMQTFSSHNEVYRHLIIEHRGYGDEEAEEDERRVNRAVERAAHRAANRVANRAVNDN